MNGVNPSDIEKFLKGLGCAPDGEPQAYSHGFGQYWITGDNKKFFVAWSGPDGEIDVRLFGRLLGQLRRSGNC